jgi:hypothetical protein
MHRTFTFQLSFTYNGEPESYPVEVTGETPEGAACWLVVKLLQMIKGAMNIKTELLYQ